MLQIGPVGTPVFATPTRVARKTANETPPSGATCPDRQLQPSSRFHTKTVLKDRRNAQTSHATFPKPARIFRRPEGAKGVRYTQNEIEKTLPLEPRPLRPGRFCGTAGSISNRHPCRLETCISPCASATSLFLIVTRQGGLFRTRFSDQQRRARMAQARAGRVIEPSGAAGRLAFRRSRIAAWMGGGRVGR